VKTDVADGTGRTPARPHWRGRAESEFDRIPGGPGRSGEPGREATYDVPLALLGGRTAAVGRDARRG